MKRIVLLSALLLAAAYLWWKGRSPPEGPYGLVALRLNESAREPCDLSAGPTRLALSRLVDQYRQRIHGLWEARDAKEFPDFKMEQVGPVFLRLNQPPKRERDFERSNWSWEEAYAIFLRTQRDPGDPETRQRWRDLDTSVRFLLERDVARILRGREFLPPESTRHSFRPGSSVKRTGRNRFEVSLHPGDFVGAEEKLAAVFENEWKSSGREVKVRWATDVPGLYRVKAHFQSGRSYVNHREKVMVIANFSWNKTVAHELGHILGFDDHYYSVWNARNCFYTQESRLTDLMSSSEQGEVGPHHWALLEKAYPWKKPAYPEVFPYIFGRKP